MKAALQMAPNVCARNVKVVFADQFFSQELILACGLEGAKLF